MEQPEPSAPADSFFDAESVRERFTIAIANASADPGITTLSREFQSLYELCGSRLRETNELRRQLTSARAQMISPSLSGGSDSSTTKLISSLRARLIEAQDDLLQGRDLERTSSGERLKLAAANARLTEDISRLRAAAIRVEAERARLVSAAALDHAAATAAGGENAVLRRELASAREERDALAVARDELATTLGSFASSRVSASGQMQAEINAANEERARNTRARETLEIRLREETTRAENAVLRSETLARDLEMARTEARVAASTAANLLATVRSEANITTSALRIAAADSAAIAAEQVLASMTVPTTTTATTTPPVSISPLIASSTSVRGTNIGHSQPPLPLTLPAPAPRGGGGSLSEARSVFGSAFSMLSSAVRTGAANAVAGVTAATSGVSLGGSGPVNHSNNTHTLTFSAPFADFASLSHSDLPIPSRARGPPSRLGEGAVVALTFLDASGARAVAASGARLLVLDTTGGERRAPLAALVAPARDAELAAVVAGANTLYAGLTDRSIAAYDVSALTCTRSIAHAHGGAVAALAWSAAGWSGGGGGGGESGGSTTSSGILVSGGASDTTVKLWDLRDRSARPVASFAARSHVNAVAFAANGSILAGCQDGSVRSFDARSSLAGGTSLRSETGVWPPRSARGAPAVTGLSLGAGGTILVSTRDTGGGSTLFLLESTWLDARGVSSIDPSPVRTMRSPGFELPSRFSRGLIAGRHCIAGSVNGSLYTWSVLGDFECTVGGRPTQGGGGLGGGRTGRTARLRRAAAAAAANDNIMGGAFAELAEDEDDGEASAAATTAAEHTGIHCCAISADGSTLATGNQSGFIALYEVESPTTSATTTSDSVRHHHHNQRQATGEGEF